MKVVRYRHLTKENVQKFTDLLSEAFKKNYFIYSYLMGGEAEKLKKFMKMDVEYNNHYADYYVLINDEEQWVAVALYLPIGCEPIGLKSALKRGKLLTVLQFFISNPIKYTKRLLEFSDLEEKHWYKGPFVPLDIVASLEKGCGKALIEETMKNYIGKNVVLNSSVDFNNHAYYSQFGFVAYENIQLDKYKTAMMIKKAEV